MHTRHIKGKYSWLKHIDFMALDILALVISFVLAYEMKFQSFGFLYDSGWKAILLIACLLDLVVILLTTPFSGIFRRYGSEELLKAVLQTVYNFVLLSIVMYILKMGSMYSRVVIFSMYGLYFLISLALRMLWKAMLRSGRAVSVGNTAKSIFVIGERAEMPQLLRSINSGFFKEYTVMGICVVDGQLGEKVTVQIDDVDRHGRVKPRFVEFENSAKVEDVADYILRNHIEELYVGVKPSVVSADTYKTLIDNGKGIHLGIRPMVGFNTEDQFITTVGTQKALGVGMYSFTGKQMVYLSIKRVMDILFGLVGLVALLPLMAVVKISYLLTGDTKSIFYTQTRVGTNGKPFKMIKFRSMVWNAEDVLQELLKDPEYKREWEENQKLEHDPRITKMGNILRRTSLDEVPQFLNLLKGDMSLIGPRPLVVGELEEHNGLQLYNMVKPGITGWWGCNGRSNTTYDERLELEYYYVKNCSLYLDLLTVVKTISVLVRRDGAI